MILQSIKVYGPTPVLHLGGGGGETVPHQMLRGATTSITNITLFKASLMNFESKSLPEPIFMKLEMYGHFVA